MSGAARFKLAVKGAAPTVADLRAPTSSDLAERLRRWIVIAGYVLGGWAILQTLLILIAWGLPFNRYFPIELLTPIHRLATALYLVSPLPLIAGCWGFQHHKRWARPVLLTYSGMWIGSLFALQGVEFIDTLSGAYGDLSFRQKFSMALGGFDRLVYASVYPVSLILCLIWPEVRDHFPEFRTGFAPILTRESK
jgi:hypothetical protein